MLMVNSRGQTILFYEGYIFHKNKRYQNSTSWECARYRNLGCRCRCITTCNDTVIKRSARGHSHKANVTSSKGRKQKARKL